MLGKGCKNLWATKWDSGEKGTFCLSRKPVQMPALHYASGIHLRSLVPFCFQAFLQPCWKTDLGMWISVPFWLKWGMLLKPIHYFPLLSLLNGFSILKTWLLPEQEHTRVAWKSPIHLVTTKIQQGLLWGDSMSLVTALRRHLSKWHRWGALIEEGEQLYSIFSPVNVCSYPFYIFFFLIFFF